MFKQYRNLPKGIYILCFATAINMAGNFIYPFLALLLTQKFGFSDSLTGVYVSTLSWIAIPAIPLGGYLADRFGRKKLIAIFQVSNAFVLILAGFFINYPQLIPILLFISSFLGSISMPFFGAMMTDLSNTENRKLAFGLHYLSINIGFAIGPLIAGYLFNSYVRLMFFGDGLTLLLASFLVIFTLKETKPTDDDVKKLNNTKEQVDSRSFIKALIARPNLIIFSFLTILMFFVFSQFTFGLPRHATFIDKIQGPKIYGSLMTTNAIVVIAFTTIILGITRKLSSIKSMALGGFLYFIGFGMLRYVNVFYLMFVSTFIWSLGEILISTNTSVYIMNHTPANQRGKFNSIFPLIRKIASGASPLVAGFIIDKYKGNIPQMWLFYGLIAGIGMIGFIIISFVDKTKKAIS